MKKKFSPTAISQYLTCPFRFYLLYIEKVAREYKPELQRGIDFHKFIEEYYKSNYAKSVFDVNNIYNDLECDFKKEFKYELEGFIKWEKYRILNKMKPISIESWLEDSIFEGRIDVIFDKLGKKICVDFKTGYSSINSLSKDMIIQGLIYKKLSNVSDVWFVFLKNKGKIVKLSKCDRNLLMKVALEVDDILKKIKEGKFFKMCTENCEYCFVRKACTLYRKKFKLVQFLLDE